MVQESLQFWKYSSDISLTLRHLSKPRDEYWVCDKYTWKLKTCIQEDLRELEQEIYQMEQAIKYHPSSQTARDLIDRAKAYNVSIELSQKQM